MTEHGPIYGVELLDVLPLDGGMQQQLPSRLDLEYVRNVSERTVAGYEVVLEHYKRLRAIVAALPITVHERKCHDCGETALHADNVMPYVRCPTCGSADTRATKRKLR